jgi:hypothetical protein
MDQSTPMPVSDHPIHHLQAGDGTGIELWRTRPGRIDLDLIEASEDAITITACLDVTTARALALLVWAECDRIDMERGAGGFRSIADVLRALAEDTGNPALAHALAGARP